MIKGLTDGSARWPRLGVLRKGAPKPEKGNAPGRDLGRMLRFEGMDDEVTADWVAQFDGTEVETLLVRLPYPDVGACWSNYMEEWVAGGLVHRCDGEICVLWRDEAGEYQHTPKPCPGNCKPVGRLDLIVPDFRRMGTVTLLTTSINDLMAIDGCIRSLAIAFGDLSRVPLVLRRHARQISTPGSNGKRQRREAWLLSLEAAPEWVRFMLDAQGRPPLELTAPDHLALPSPNGDATDDDLIDVDEDTGEISAATDVDVPAPMDDTGAESGPETPEPTGWTERIAACETLRDLKALSGEINDAANFDNEFHQQNARRRWYARIVEVIQANVMVATPPTLDVYRKALDGVPDDTPGKSAAVDQVEDASLHLASMPTRGAA